MSELINERVRPCTNAIKTGVHSSRDLFQRPRSRCGRDLFPRWAEFAVHQCHESIFNYTFLDVKGEERNELDKAARTAGKKEKEENNE